MVRDHRKSQPDDPADHAGDNRSKREALVANAHSSSNEGEHESDGSKTRGTRLDLQDQPEADRDEREQ